ncbi:DUF4352 domain-containing protein [Rhodococcus sp. X156]|uniref:DUF4352 domain-containing protein n=1 Tax=Rhodococcus sp. X156 TaxID=2499145 RepID=UPI001F499BCA|nr:DUF4352 domain-containing protein [Rhodococcus sp. X156]
MPDQRHEPADAGHPSQEQAPQFASGNQGPPSGYQGAPGPGYQPGYGQQPPLNKKDAKAQAAAARAYAKSQRSWFMRHKFLTALAALIVLIIVIVMATSAGGGSDSDSAGGSGSSEQASQATIGTPVRDGKFEFVVNAVQPGTPTVGSEPLQTTAQGQFVVVKLSVRNIGDRQQIFNQSAQKLIDQQGRELSTSTVAGAYLDSNNFLAEINPGNSVDGTIVFDIPKDAVPTTLELHDSVFSGGVKVQLS